MPKLFISYARKDDEAFAERLYQDLTHAYQFEVWWDREKMRSRGQTFLQEIRDAIFACDYLILVVGPHANESDYVREEWEHALHYYKTVIPVLRLGDFDLVPERLRKLHAYDFRDDDQYHDQLARLAGDIRRGPLQLAPLMGVPDLPPHFLPRPDDMEAVNAAVLADLNTPTVITAVQQAVTLRGMGGIGKSVIAAAFARAGDTRRAFTDGIAWIAVGQSADPRALYQRVGMLLGDNAQLYTDELTAKAALQKFLADKVCLLVLDDVWQVKHAAPFKDIVAGTRCRLLITTRKQQISQELGAQEHRVRLLDADQAHRLLREWAGRDDPDLLAVADRLDGLPLALKIAGGRLQRGLTGAEWLEKYDHVSQMRSVRKPSERDESLEICIDLGVEAVLAAEDEKRLYYTFGIFEEDVRIPQPVVVRLWRQIAPTYDETECLEILDDLVDMALIERHEDRAITLHNLLHDYTREHLGDQAIPVHHHLLNAYQADCPGGWHTGPNDGYFFEHLAYHLREAGRQPELYTLLTGSSDWMEAKFAACVGDTSYMADLDLALSDFADPLNTDQLLILSQLHTARQVVHARVSIYNDTDLKTLVWLGREREALSHARLRSEPHTIFDGLMAIYRAQRQRQRADLALLEEASRVARSISDVERQATALCDLASALAQAGDICAPAAFGEAETLAHGLQDDEERMKALSTLAAALALAGDAHARAMFEEAEVVARSIPDEEKQMRALSALAAALTLAGDAHASAMFEEAETVANGIKNEWNRVSALSALAATLAQAGQFEAARAVARNIQAEEMRGYALSNLAAAWAQAGQFEEADKVARSIQIEEMREYALSNLAAAQAQAGLFEEAGDVARNISNAGERAHALSALAAALAQAGKFEEAGDVLEEAGTAVRSIQHEEQIVFILSDLAAALTQAKQFEEAGIVVRSISDGWNRARVLSGLAVTLAQAGRFEEAQLVSRSIQDDERRTEALCGLAAALAQAIPTWADTAFDEARTVVHSIQNEGKRASALLTLATALAQTSQFEQAGVVARDIEYEWRQAAALNALVAALAQAGHFDKAMAVACSIQNLRWRSEALHDLASALAEAGRFEEAEAVAHGIQSKVWLVSSLRNLAAKLAKAGGARTEVVFKEAEIVARGISDEYARASALRDLTATLVQAGQFEAAETVAHSIPDEEMRGYALSALAVGLAQTGQFEAAETVAHSIPDEKNRVSALSALAVGLAQVGDARSGVIYKKAGIVARGIANERMRGAALRDLALALAQVGHWANVFSTLDTRQPDEYVQELARWAQSLEKVQPGLLAKVLRETVRIVGWVRPDWRDVYDLLAADEPPQA